MKAEVCLINAFTQNGRGGNPAAVMLDAQNLTAAQKQRIAAGVSLSETAFVSPSACADVKLEFFTPLRQIAHCGHATIATFAYLKQNGAFMNQQSAVKETIDGLRTITFKENEVYMEQKAPVYPQLSAEDEQLIYQSLGLSATNLRVKPALVNTGNTFMILQVPDEAALANLQPQFDQITAISEKYNLIGYYVFTRSQAAGIDATTRMFAPAYGIEEEAATGMAAGPLAAYLYRSGICQNTFCIEQGRFMRNPSPSLIRVKLQLTDGHITSLYAGGEATFIEKRLIDYD